MPVRAPERHQFSSKFAVLNGLVWMSFAMHATKKNFSQTCKTAAKKGRFG